MVRIRGGKSASFFAISSCFLCRLSFLSLSNLACVFLLRSHPLSLLRPLICSSVSDSDPISSRSIVLTLSTVSLIGKLQIYLCPVAIHRLSRGNLHQISAGFSFSVSVPVASSPLRVLMLILSLYRCIL